MIILIKEIFSYQKRFGNLILLLVAFCLIFPVKSESLAYFKKESNQSFLEFQTKEVEKEAKNKEVVFLNSALDEDRFAYTQNHAFYSQNAITAPFNFYSWSQAP